MRTAVLTANIAHPLSQELRRLLAAALAAPPAALVPLDQAESLLFRFQPQALAVVLSPNPDRALAALSKVRTHFTGPVLAVGPTGDPKLILRALNEGVNHYLDEDNLEAQLEDAAPRLLGKDEPAPPEAGQLISVLAASGGSGASTLAANLAVVLARVGPRCALVDLKPGVGDLAALLDLKPTHTLADLCLNPQRVDQALLEKALIVHPCGVSLLAPPQQYEDIQLVTPHGVQKALSVARKCFPFIVVDHEDCFHEEQVLTLRQADRILLVARLDFTSLRNTRRVLNYLTQMNIGPERIQVVVNRTGQARELPVAEVEEALGIKVAHQIPDDPGSVNPANNTGVPVVLKAPSSKAAQAIQRLAKALLPSRAEPSSPTPSSRSGMFRWLASFG
jgi:pilus assembly protein CpaE